jgi:hypothetical protein
MVRAPCKFKQRDVTRALKAAFAAGVKVPVVRIDKDGTINIVANPSTAEDENALAEFRRLHGYG